MQDTPMTPVERVLIDHVADCAAAFSRHGARRETMTALELEIQASLRRALGKLDIIMVVSPAPTSRGFCLETEVES